MNIKIHNPLCFSEVGQKPNQEDALFPLRGAATPATRTFMVCDGMGGHEHGEVASLCVTTTVGQRLNSVPLCTTAQMRNHFDQALAAAYQALDRLDTDPHTLRKMGTTLTLLALCTDGVFVAHIGDSRVYQLRRGQGIVFQTHDHSLVNDLIAAGELTEESAHNFPQKNVITRAVQPHQEHPAKASCKVLTDVRAGDLFFLCCDGIVEQLDNADLTRILLADQPLDQRIGQLRRECADRHTRDNNSCYAIEVAEVEGAGPAAAVAQATESVTVTRPTPPRTRHRLWWLIAAAAVVLLICLLFFFLKAPDNPRQPVNDTPANTQGVQAPIHRHQ